MKTVRIGRAAFIDKVTANRDAHRELFEAAFDGYRKFLVDELTKRLDEALAGKKVDRYIRLEEPEDHTADYDRLLMMAEMSVDDVLEMTQQEFGWYLLDQWAWKDQFIQTAGTYTVS